MCSVTSFLWFVFIFNILHVHAALHFVLEGLEKKLWFKTICNEVISNVICVCNLILYPKYCHP